VKENPHKETNKKDNKKCKMLTSVRETFLKHPKCNISYDEDGKTLLLQ